MPSSLAGDTREENSTRLRDGESLGDETRSGPVALPSEGFQMSSAGLRTRGRSGLSAGAYWPSLPDPTVSASDGGRSRSPLRGSPGFAPGSLFTPRIEGHRRRPHDIGRRPFVKPAIIDGHGILFQREDQG